MTKNILCAIDGTEHANPALEFAADLAKRWDAKLTVCTVNAIVGGMRSPRILAQPEEVAEKTVQSGAEKVRKQGVSTVKTAVLEARDIGAAIVQYADQSGFDHIVTGTGGKGGLARLALGSVATDVANRAHCPVTVVR